MEESHQLSLSTKEYKMLIKLVASGQFIINAPYAPIEEDFDKEIFTFADKLINDSYDKAPDIDIDEIILEPPARGFARLRGGEDDRSDPPRPGPPRKGFRESPRPPTAPRALQKARGSDLQDSAPGSGRCG